MTTIQTDFLIIGGGVAAVTAAQTLRNEGEKGSILLLCAEPDYPYNRPPLTKGFITGRLSRDQLRLASPESYEQNNLTLRLDCRVEAIEPAAHRVRDQSGTIYQYGKLLIATGGQARQLALPGAQMRGAFTFRTLADADALRHWLQANTGPVVIVGTSFIAMELASSLTGMGLPVSLIDRTDHVFPRIHSPQLSAHFLEGCRRHGIDVHLGQTVTRILGTRHVTGVETSAGQTLACDTLIMAIGTEAQTELLAGSDIQAQDGIMVDEFLQTSAPDIYAAGDVVSYLDNDGDRQRAMHWQNAREQGQLAARNMLGQRIPYTSVLHYYCDFLDFSFTFLGTSDDADHRIKRGNLKDHSFAEFYLQGDRIIGLFSTGRPPEETQLVETLIRDRTPVSGAHARLADAADDLKDLAHETILVLQGGAALGAFECGVIKAMHEDGIMPSVVGGVSIGAINGALIAGNPTNYAEAVEAFWEDIGVSASQATPDAIGRAFAISNSVMWGIPEFFRPRWMAPPGLQGEWWPPQWTSLYDLTPLAELLGRYIDFDKLPESPIRLIISAVEVDRGEQVFFDSHIDTFTPEHILASCSLPPIFPWTTINGRHYWDGGIVSNSPLEHVLNACGTDNKQIFLVDLFPGERPLPTNLAEVFSRRDEIIYGERIRNDAHVRELVQEFQTLVDDIMTDLPQADAARLKEHPRYVRLMGQGTSTSITHIVRDGSEREPLAAAYDFSMTTIRRHQKEGYLTAQRKLAKLVRKDNGGP